MNSRSQTPDPRQWRKSNLDSTKKVECRSNHFFLWMHIHGQLYAPAREQALPQFELQVKQAARQRASERASDPIQPFTLDLPSQFWVPCDFSSPIWGVCVHLLPATKVPLALSYYFKPQKTRTTKIFFFPFTGKKRQVKYWHSRI